MGKLLYKDCTPKYRQARMFGTSSFPSYEEIVDKYSREFKNLITPNGETTFGFWMQTIADLELLDIEIEGLVGEYKIDFVNRVVEFKDGDVEFLRRRIAHLEKIKGQVTLYTEFVDSYNDTNAYAFHNIYPYKGKFYPRVVRTLINAFNLSQDSLILDPFNGSGTTTHEASLMGIKSVGIDVTPMGVIISTVKNELPFLAVKDLEFKLNDLVEIISLIEKRQWKHHNKTIEKLMLLIYFDTVDAFERTSRYNKKGKKGLFIEKFEYIKDCYNKIRAIKDKYNLDFVRAQILEEDALKLGEYNQFRERFDAIITSPPYYFSLDYVGKDKIAYDYLGLDMRKVEEKYLGMKNSQPKNNNYEGLPPKVARYYEDLRVSIHNMYKMLKPGGYLAIIVGDSTVKSKKIPTTMMTKLFCEEAGFHFKRLIFNPLLGVRNRAIRGESIIICQKLKGTSL